MLLSGGDAMCATNGTTKIDGNYLIVVFIIIIIVVVSTKNTNASTISHIRKSIHRFHYEKQTKRSVHKILSNFQNLMREKNDCFQNLQEIQVSFLKLAK